jgi:hypothetical protein
MDKSHEVLTHLETPSFMKPSAAGAGGNFHLLVHPPWRPCRDQTLIRKKTSQTAAAPRRARGPPSSLPAPYAAQTIPPSSRKAGIVKVAKRTAPSAGNGSGRWDRNTAHGKICATICCRCQSVDFSIQATETKCKMLASKPNRLHPTGLSVRVSLQAMRHQVAGRAVGDAIYPI